MVVHFVSESCFTDLIQPLELVEADGVTVRHYEPVEENSEPLLAERLNLLRFSQHFRASGDKDLLAVVRVDVRRHQTIDWPRKRAVQAVDEQGFKDRALEDHVSFPGKRIECSGPGCFRVRSL